MTRTVKPDCGDQGGFCNAFFVDGVFVTIFIVFYYCILLVTVILFKIVNFCFCLLVCFSKLMLLLIVFLV